MPDIVFVASFIVGLTVRLPRMPYPGESRVADLFDMGPGGKGTNMAVAAARQGAAVSVIVKVGDDLFADLAFDLYKAEHMDTAHILRTQVKALPPAWSIFNLTAQTGRSPHRKSNASNQTCTAQKCWSHNLRYPMKRFVTPSNWDGDTSCK